MAHTVFHFSSTDISSIDLDDGTRITGVLGDVTVEDDSITLPSDVVITDLAGDSWTPSYYAVVDGEERAARLAASGGAASPAQN